MSHLLTVLFRTIISFGLFFLFLSSEKSFSQSCNNWLNTPSQPSWVNIGDVDVAGTQLTVEALINIKGIPPGGVIQGLDVVSKHTGPTNVNYLLRSSHAELSTTNGYYYTPDACDLEMNKTYHVAMVYNGVSLKYYRNGFLMGETPATGNMIQNDLPTGIGFISTLIQAENFIGFINEVRIWSVARSQNQIRAYMNGSLPNPATQTGLLAYHTFDNLLNKQGNTAWNGTLVGAASINQTNPECVFTPDSCAVPSSCDESLSIPTLGSKVTIGDVDVTGNKLTVEAMFNRSAPLNNGVYYGHLVSKHTDQTNVNYALLPNGCEITTAGSGYKAIFQDCVPELGKTYHVAMVYDGATLKFYRNGFLMSQVACTGNLINNNLLTTIGQVARGDDPFDNQFLGYTNEVRIWNVARTQAQVATYMNGTLPNPATQVGLVAYHSFNNLDNKQGNAAFNGTINGNAAIGKANPDCAFVPSACNTVTEVTPGFIIPDTVCVNTPVNISNISLNATSYYWNFCSATTSTTPTGVNLGNTGGSLSSPVFSDVVNDNGNYYVFVSNNWPGGLVRLDFGNSLLNTPAIVNLGNVGGIIPNTIEGIQVVKNEGRWYAIMVGGDIVSGGIPSRVIKIDFGINITNATPVGTNWGNIGNLSYPVDLHVFQENGTWYGFTVNAQNNTITRFNFSNSFNNIPTGLNLGNLGGLNYPTGINAIKDNGNWHVFITNDVVNSFLVRLNFGNSLLNTPTAVNLGNPGNVLHKTRDIYIMKGCDQITGLAVNGDGYSDLVKLDFNNNILSTPTGVSLGNTGNMDFPHSISKLFRVENDLYSFVTNVKNNTLTRIRFEGCNNSSIPNSPLQDPPPVTYTTPGTYSINLTVDEGLPTQSSVCKQIVVKDCTIPVIPDFEIPDTVCVNTPVNITNTTTGATSHYWNFCVADINQAPVGTNLGNIGGLLSQPVFMDYVFYNGNYYGFSINHYPGKLVRLNFGNSLLNTPTATDLGNFGGIIPTGYGAEGIQIIQNEGKWYAIIVGGYTPSGSTPRVLKVDFGTNLLNATPVATNWGNIGNMLQPIDLHVFKENNNWYGLTINAENNTITRFNFTNSFDNTPTADNLGGFGMLDYPTGIFAINDNGFWRVFITNNGSNSRLVRLDFGSSLLNAPTAVNLGSIGNTNGLRDLTIIKYCDQVAGFAVNAITNSLYRLNFSTLTSAPTVINLGNTGNLSTPHSISKLFRVNDDLYGFITNVGNNTITRLRFQGCTNSDPANSALQNPAPVTYNTPGTYNINLTIDDGLPTQSSVCKQIVVKECCPIENPDFSIKQDPCNPKSIQIETNLTNIQNYEWDFGDGQTNTGDPNPVVTYTDFGSYIIKLKTENTAGCIDSIEKQISVNVIYDNVIITNDTTICYGTTKQLITASALSFCWSPITYLDNPNSPNPVTSATEDITYYFTAEVTGANLIANGDFSQGNTGFSSAYQYVPSSGVAEGVYNIGSNIKTWHSAFNACNDHTSANGNMMMINGSPASDLNIWKQTVPVIPNTNYAYSIWIQSIVTGNPAQLQFSINGKDAGAIITAINQSCVWSQFYTTWNSGDNTTADISIVNKNTLVQGNDFALDDISFAPVFIKRDSVIIKVEKPIVQTNDDTSFCPGSSIQLNTTGAQNYSWSPETGLSNAGMANPLASPVVSTEYIVTGTTVNGCTAKDTINVNIYPKPVITLSDDTTICKNALAQLFVTGGTGYSWSPAATLNDPLIANPLASPVVNTMYYVTVTDVNTCENIDSVQVAIRPDEVFSIDNPAPVCRFDSVQLNASGGDIYAWEPANGLNNTGISNPWVSPSENTEYKVTITETTCNQSETLSATVIVKPLPIVNAVKSNDIDCRNDQSQLAANGADQYLWAPSATLSNPLINNPVATPATATQYIVTGTAVNGCSAKDTIDVNVIPKASIVVSGDALICRNAPTPLFGGGGESYSWFPAATLNNNLIANPVASPNTSTIYYVTITDANNCEYLDSVKVNVRPDPVFSVSDPGKVCLFDSARLTASGGDLYAWQPANGLSNTNISNPWVTPSATTEYMVTITETTCNQSTTLSTKLTVSPPPTVTAFKSNDIDCSSDRSQLNAVGADQYEWSSATTLSNPGIRNPIATPLSTTGYIVKGTDATGCTGYDTITVKVENINKGGYLMPNAFTPNNDGLNDCFRIKYWGVINDLEFSIYNRWGERIFFTRDAAQCWDGTYKGVQQDGGVYVYMIKASSICEAQVFRKGTFVLVR